MSEKPVRRSRARHAGSITSYATQSGQRWKFQIYVPQDPERPELGDTRLTRGGFKSLDEAQRVLAEALTKKKSNAQFQAKAPTIGDYTEHWIAGLRLQNSTIQGYKRIIRNHVTPHLGAIQLDKLTATRIAAHYRQLETSGRRDKPGYKKPLSANSVSKVHVLLAAMLDAAVDDGLILMNPAKKKRTVNPPSSSQVRAQKAEIITWTGPQLHAFLTWNHEEFDDEIFPLWRTIAYVTTRNKAKTTKTGSVRVLDLDTDTFAVLKAYKAKLGAISLSLARADAYVFGNNAGEIRSPNEVSRRWTSRVQRAQAELDELPRVTLKGLRHTHATLLLELGEHPKVVQERLGHSTVTTTMNIYSHVTPTRQKAAVTRLAAHLDGA